MISPKNGSWVKVRLEGGRVPDGAHQSQDSYIVGVYLRGGYNHHAKRWEPDRVAIARPDGTNLSVPDTLNSLEIPLVSLEYLAMCQENDIPNSRRRHGKK